MPHRLRRVIAVNIRNASTNAASQQIAMLDLRAHTMAIGENGVGKSSFMRLIPLFYGATPERILRGTQKHNLISYTLPGSSSAVAFEYEREDEDDLRLAVMFAKPGTERPEFMIIDGGYKEMYFVDANGHFVNRDIFKDRLEALGIEVSPRFELSEYRSVILYEHRHTKEARGLRPWAARHSLGPASLYGLDLIAVAMTSEKLLFRDFQSLVLERLNDSGYEGARNSNARQMRKDRKDVDSWLANARHAQEVLGETARKKTIEEQVGKVTQIALDLGSLRVACELSVNRRIQEFDVLDVELGAIKSALAELEATWKDGGDRHAQTVADAKQHYDEAKLALEEISGKESRFAAISIQSLVKEEDLQGEYAYDKQIAITEHKSLTERVNDAEQTLQTTLATVEKVLQARNGQIQAQRETTSKDCETQVAAVEQERNVALQKFDSADADPALAHLEFEIDTHRHDIGVQDALSRSAEAPEETIANLQQAEAALEFASAAVTECSQLAEQSRSLVEVGEVRRGQSLGSLNQVEAQLAEAESRHKNLQAQLNPPDGSVLAALRSQPSEQWFNIAKVLDPDQLLRTDLTPHFDESAVASDVVGSSAEIDGVRVGHLYMNVAPIELPRWSTQDGARQRLAESQQQVERLRTENTVAHTAAKKVQTELDAARKALQRYEHELNRAKSSQSETVATHNRAKELINVDIQRVRKAHGEEANKLRSTLGELNRQVNALKRGEQQRRISLSEQFGERIGQLRLRRDTALERLIHEAAAAEQAAEVQRKSANDAHAAVLKGKGVDPEKVIKLQKHIANLDEKLLAIAQSAHHVQAWRQFERELRPLKSQREEYERTSLERFTTAVKDQTRFVRELEEKRNALHKSENSKTSMRRAIEQELNDLRRLADQQLSPYRVQGPPYAGDDGYPTLSESTKTRLDMLGTATQKLESATRDLCSKMRERISEISVWLDRSQTDHRARVEQHGDAYLRHEQAVDWGRAVVEWFEPLTHRQYHIALRQEMEGLFAAAESFVNHINNFEARVTELNGQFQRSLALATGFKRFDNLQIRISSTASSSPELKSLREMRDVNRSRTSSHRTTLAPNPQLPTSEEIDIVRVFRNHLPDTGALTVNLDEHVRLEFELMEIGKLIKIDNDRSMQGLSSTGLTVLITMMFLLSFLGIVRGSRSPVGMTWVLDEVGRVSPANMLQYLDVLAQQNVMAVCAAPSIDPALGALFESSHLFEDDGSIGRPAAEDDDGMIALEENIQ
ncbi:MAG: ATP-binding protein [Glutamicibacter sp.]